MDTVLSSIFSLLVGNLSPQWQHIVMLSVFCLFFLSEILAAIPQVKANSVFQLLFGLLKYIKDNYDASPVKEAEKIDGPIRAPSGEGKGKE